ncbi:Serine/threonine-protein kinase SRPK like [Verticillium longisporum]|nr:Serine/threonine-protein kinase SRPK like [Verticillium longisporum]
MASSQQFSNLATPLKPREFPSSGFQVIDPSDKVEEERLPFYKPENYYPMRIGQVIQDRYQIVAKLGYGTSSTVWLSRDLRAQKYWALKVHINGLRSNQELKVYRHLADINGEDHPGQEYVRRLEDAFKLKGPDGEHDVFVMTPLGMSLRSLQEMQKDDVFQKNLVMSVLDQALLGLAFLHEANVVHTDLHSDNLLIAITDDSILFTVEDNEIHRPSPRKEIGDTIVYVSQYVLGGAGPLTICDLGQARIGSEHFGNAMPLPYRAPEVILNMPWGYAVDAWSVGLLAWDLLEQERLFRIYDQNSEEQNDAYHLAAMTALLGPPPTEFLERSKETSKYWDEDGRWKGLVPLPSTANFEFLSRALTGEDKDNFLDFIRGFLSWLPEERPTVLQGYLHPWLRGKR